ncbi:MAG: TetR/AcrR family transcriptional regulator [Desulfobacterales bacterium]|nr:TetR/AcrR family transcriptional regulator [Desulfobacterales bacterium]
MPQKRQKTEVRQKQIVDAARKLIFKQGSEHVTIRGLAKEVGISEAAVYRHFRSKRDILSFLADYITDSMMLDLDKIKGESDYSLDLIEKGLKNHFSQIEQRRGMTFLVLAEIISFGDKKLNKQLAANIDRYLLRLKDLLFKVSGTVRKDIDLENAALLLFGMIQGLVTVWALNNFRFDLMEKYSSLWDVFRHGLQETENR